MILTESYENGMTSITADRHVPGDSNVTSDGPGGPGNPNPLIPKGPRDLHRSRRIGLVRVVCTVCGAERDQGLTLHKPGCSIESAADEFGTPKWRRETTGPLSTRQTSRDTGWH